MKGSLGMLFIAMFLALFLLSGCSGVKEDAIKEAVDKKDPSLCNKLEEKSDKEGCFEEVAQQLHDPAKCSGSVNANGCITAYALKSRSTAPCDLIADAVGKYACIAGVTGDQTGRSIDTLLAEWRNKNVLALCSKKCEEDSYNTCRPTCVATQQEWHNYCVEHDPDNLGACFAPYDLVAKNCIEDCQWAQWECNDGCKKSVQEQ